MSDTGNHTVRQIVVATGYTSTLAGLAGSVGSTDAIGDAARFNTPRGLAIDGAGNLFVADTGNHTIRKIEIATGTTTTIAGMAEVPGTADDIGELARFNGPRGLAIDGAGNLFVADMGNHVVRRIDLTTGAVMTVVGTPARAKVAPGPLPAGLNHPTGVALGTGGELLIIDESGLLAVR